MKKSNKSILLNKYITNNIICKSGIVILYKEKRNFRICVISYVEFIWCRNTYIFRKFIVFFYKYTKYFFFFFITNLLSYLNYKIYCFRCEILEFRIPDISSADLTIFSEIPRGKDAHVPQ